MASNSETGHAVNNSNFKILIDKCTAFGPAYNPSNTDLTIANMTTLWKDSDGAHQALTSAVQNAKNPINDREILFKPVRPLVTRVVNYFKSTKAGPEIIKDVLGLADKYRGFGVKVVRLPDGTPDPKFVSTSHLSFVQRADTFRQMVELLANDINYAPNEVELQIVTLKAISDSMKKLNDNIGTILGPVDVLRITRNKALYDDGTGIYDVAKAVRRYVRAVYGATSAESRLITALKFTKAR